jgi:gas vesicle protein
MRRVDYDDEPTVIIERSSGGVGSFILGVAIGAAAALLLAPQSGAATRRDIRRGARRASRAATDLAGDISTRVTDTFEQARDRVETGIDTARQAIDLKKRQVSRAMEAGRAAAQQARDELERRIAETKAAYNAGVDVARSGSAAALPAADDLDIDDDAPER